MQRGAQVGNQLIDYRYCCLLSRSQPYESHQAAPN